MKRLWQILKEYGVVIIAALVAGIITGACTPTPPPTPTITPTRCYESQPIRLMPNWIQSEYPPYIDRQV